MLCDFAGTTRHFTFSPYFLTEFQTNTRLKTNRIQCIRVSLFTRAVNWTTVHEIRNCIKYHTLDVVYIYMFYTTSVSRSKKTSFCGFYFYFPSSTAHIAALRDLRFTRHLNSRSPRGVHVFRLLARYCVSGTRKKKPTPLTIQITNYLLYVLLYVRCLPFRSQ